MKQKAMPNHIINTIMLITISTVMFGMPFLLFIQSHTLSTLEVLYIVFTYLIMLTNEIVFILYSELVKIWCGNINFAKKMKKLYSIFFKKENGTKILCVLMIVVNIIAIIFQYLFFKKILSLLATLFLLLIYIIGIYSFSLIPKYGKNLYRKRDFLLFRPIPIITTPFCIAMFLIDSLKGDFYGCFLLLINLLTMILYLAFLKKETFTKKNEFTVVTIVAIIIFILVYFFVAIEIRGWLFKNLDIFFFAVCNSIYICLLYTLMYARIFLIRTESFKNSIQKYQIFMFAFFPIIAFPLFLFLTNASIHLFLFGVINLIAYNSISKSEPKSQTFLSILLIVLFLIVSFSTLSIRSTSIFNVQFNFSIKAIITIVVEVLSGFGVTISSNKIIDWFCKRINEGNDKTVTMLTLIKKPKYVASFGSSITLLLLSIIFEITVTNGMKFYVIYIYILINLILTIAQFYIEYNKNHS